MEFTKDELLILIQLVRQANSETAQGKIALGTLQAKLENMVQEESLGSSIPASSNASP